MSDCYNLHWVILHVCKPLYTRVKETKTSCRMVTSTVSWLCFCTCARSSWPTDCLPSFLYLLCGPYVPYLCDFCHVFHVFHLTHLIINTRTQIINLYHTYCPVHNMTQHVLCGGVKCIPVHRNRLGFNSCVNCVHTLRHIVNWALVC